MDHKENIYELKEKIRRFCEERDWDQFHGAKELAIGVITESSELLEHFRFKTNKESDKMLLDSKKKAELSKELADTFYFVLRFAQKYNIDLSDELIKKIKENGLKYPIEKAKGSSKKYTEF